AFVSIHGGVIGAQYSAVLGITSDGTSERIRFQPAPYPRVTVDPVTYALQVDDEMVSGVHDYERANMSLGTVCPPWSDLPRKAKLTP
ncbi:hypothetical protein, partial [Reyranella sp.]|uniref:hypothetical protein n=1 Tax=Reyranella sp. TaxID=1929291 RepID=UPI00271D0566